MGSHMDINMCTDACTHSKQGVGTEMGDRHKQCHAGVPLFPYNYSLALGKVLGRGACCPQTSSPYIQRW